MNSMMPDQQNSSLSNSNSSDAEKNLIGLIEFEIKRIQDEESQPGWTIWALLGSLTTLIWLGLQEIEKNVGGINIQNIFFIILLMSLLIDCIKLISDTLMPDPKLKKITFTPSGGRFQRTRGRSLVLITRSVALLLITHIFLGLITPVTALGINFFYGLYIGIYALSFLVSFIGLPIPLYTAAIYRLNNFFYFGLGAIGLYALSGLIGALINHMISPSIPDLKLGGLSVAIMEIFIILSQGRQETPLIKSLADIRQNVVFGRIDIESAKRQTEIALAGMPASDMFQDELAILLTDLEKINVLVETMTKENRIIVDVIDKEHLLTLADDQIALIEAVFISTNSRLDDLSKIQASFRKKYKRFKQRVELIARIFSETKTEIESLLNNLEQALETAIQKQQNLRKQRQNFSEMLEKTRLELEQVSLHPSNRS